MPHLFFFTGFLSSNLKALLSSTSRSPTIPLQKGHDLSSNDVGLALGFKSTTQVTTAELDTGSGDFNTQTTCSSVRV